MNLVPLLKCAHLFSSLVPGLIQAARRHLFHTKPPSIHKKHVTNETIQRFEPDLMETTMRLPVFQRFARFGLQEKKKKKKYGKV